MKRKKRKLKDCQQDAMSVLTYLLAEAYETGKDFHYRLRLPYGPKKSEDGMIAQVEIVVDFSVYFDGELSDERNESERVTKFKITGPDKGKH
jgi:hypothetical protein